MQNTNTQAILDSMNADIYQRFKRAVELRKWPNGVLLTQEQVKTCMEAIIVYEHAHLINEQKTGYVPPKIQPCADDSHIHSHEQPIKWKDS